MEPVNNPAPRGALVRGQADAGSVVGRLAEIYERCMQAEPVLVWDKESGGYVESGRCEFDSKGALKALELIGKHIGMFDKRVSLTLKNEGAPLVVQPVYVKAEDTDGG